MDEPPRPSDTVSPVTTGALPKPGPFGYSDAGWYCTVSVPPSGLVASTRRSARRFVVPDTATSWFDSHTRSVLPSPSKSPVCA